MRLDLFCFAEFAANTQENKLVVAGIFNSVQVRRLRQPGFGKPDIFPMPHVYLAAIVRGSLGEGLKHHAKLRVVNDDGKVVFDKIELGDMNFVVNEQGRPMQFQAVIGINGLPLPGVGEYSFEFILDGKRLGATDLYVDALPEP